MSDGASDFSFSGLKTAVRSVRRAGICPAPAQVADIAASLPATAVKMLVRKTVKRPRSAPAYATVLTGGVAANTALREALEGECRERGWALHVPSRRLCTDNAAMIAPAASHDRLEAGERAPLSLNAVPDLVLA
jgi:N6-L-threonylcarbamoyladenine synthase